MVHLRYRIGFFLGAVMLLFGVIFLTHIEGMQTAVSDQVLRLHIIANSDSPQEQALKLQVRDRILKDCSHLFADCNSAADAAAVARRNSALLQRTAKDELQRHGVLQPVSVWIGPRRFPTKTYGSVRLPAGEYTSLNLRIGTGSGQNWWCVMYPPLCLTETAVTADEETLSILKKELSAEEYALVTETEDIQINVKFKLAEILGRWF